MTSSRRMLTDDFFETNARGDERITARLDHLRIDLDPYLVRIVQNPGSA